MGRSKERGAVSKERMSRCSPEEVCCHSDRCGLFFFWLPLLHAGHVLGSGCHDNPTTPVSHTAVTGRERETDKTEGKKKKEKKKERETDDDRQILQ